jgi:uncharacterized protein (TIGR03086 family)
VSDALALADMDSAIAGAQAIVAGIRDEQWTAPTPCTGVDVRALVNHLVTGNLHFAALVNETPRPDGDADHLGADPMAAFGRAAADLRAALRRSGALAGMYRLPAGTVPGAALVQIRIVEHLGHGWDLARAYQRTLPRSTGSRASSAARSNVLHAGAVPGRMKPSYRRRTESGLRL